MTSKNTSFQPLNPAIDLTQNLLKLSDGLRQAGLNKHADELESKLMAYKRANSLYQTSKEEGKDLVDAAHPEGSHKLEGVDGDSVVETILDQHIKILDKVNKKPTGKLASNQEIIQAVKVALAQSPTDIKQLLASAYDNVRKAYDLARRLGKLSGITLSAVSSQVKSILSSIDKQPDQLTTDDIDDAIWSIKIIRTAFAPRLAAPFIHAGIEDKEVWEKVYGYLQVALEDCEKAKSILKEVSMGKDEWKTEAGPAVIEHPEADNLMTDIDSAIETLKSYKMFISSSPKFDKFPSAKDTALKWIDQQSTELLKQKNLLTSVSKLSADRVNELLPKITETVQGLRAEVSDFAQKWVK